MTTAPRPSLDNAALAQIAGLARAGRLDEAALQVARAIGAGTDDARLLALGGAIECHRQRFERAAPWLAAAQRLVPGDPVVRANLVEALYHTGQRAAARGLCDEASARADRSLRIARFGAHLAHEDEDFAAAVALYRVTVAADPRDWAAWNNLGNALAPLGDVDGAIAALRKALALAPDSPPMHINLAQTLIEGGRTDDARAVLTAAAARFPGDANPHLALFRLANDAGQGDAAYAAIAEAARRAPDNPDILADHGHVAAEFNRYDVATAAFAAARAVDPAHGPATVGLAAVLERTNREGELAVLRERALAAGAVDATIAFIETLEAIRDQRFADALAALDRAGDVMVAVRKWHLRGTILDRLGESDAAFAAFAEMNRTAAESPVAPVARGAAWRAGVRAATAVATREWARDWTPPVRETRPAPVFIAGFPRSGTTLLDTMLLAEPGVRVLEEQPFITDLQNELGGLAALPGLDVAAIAAARDRYFARAEALVDLPAGGMLVDKHPLHLANVPMILRLFPEARFVLAQRHPCDVLLSCFFANFRLNDGMASFLDLMAAADMYDAAFACWQGARGVWAPAVHTVVYERLVADPEGELAPLFAWLGLPRPAQGFDHRGAARARGAVTTASYAQVTEPVYTRSAGRWRRYAGHLAPVLPVLAPWAARWGYAIDDDRVPARTAQ